MDASADAPDSPRAGELPEVWFLAEAIFHSCGHEPGDLEREGWCDFVYELEDSDPRVRLFDAAKHALQRGVLVAAERSIGEYRRRDILTAHKRLLNSRLGQDPNSPELPSPLEQVLFEPRRFLKWAMSTGLADQAGRLLADREPPARRPASTANNQADREDILLATLALVMAIGHSHFEGREGINGAEVFRQLENHQGTLWPGLDRPPLQLSAVQKVLKDVRKRVRLLRQGGVRPS